LRNRVIPVILLDGRRLIKGHKFKKYQYVGDPINTVKIFNEKEVDELLIYDISTTTPNLEYIESLAEECFIPLTYGGGISKLSEVESLFKLGVEKV
ncbi:HisA/HisF-related TIM barrel protein, partial [Staphylococcus aureus]|uniref:HisA/HisF-related TIM barrel protein n=1 Tax=Staphylococcus aureus TaxID=1280 RepID=UPI00301D839F